MRAVHVLPDGGLTLSETPAPALRDGEVMLEVRATALNRADLSQRRGRYPPPPGESEILGLEAAGVVARLGPGVSETDLPRGVALGGPACALLTGGGYAELVAVPVKMLMPVPQGWTWAQSAALPEATLTAYLNLFLEAVLKSGETALIHAGASGVGNAAIRLAKLAGCRVVATAGGPQKVALCRELGADIALDRYAEPFREALAERSVAVDVVLDPVGKDYLGDDLAVLATGGRIVYIASLSGNLAELDIRLLMSKRARLIGSTLRNRPVEEKAEITASFLREYGAALASGELAPVIDSVYPLAEVEAAHALMAANRNSGKIVLEVIPGTAAASPRPAVAR